MMPSYVLRWLLMLARQVRGRAVDQLQHSLQTATRAVQAGAPEDLIITALCHDLGKVVSWRDHGRRTAAILKPYVSEHAYHIVSTHEEFHQRFYKKSRVDPDARLKYEGAPWYEDAIVFVDEWDHRSFDPAYDTMSLRDFAPLIQSVFARPRPGFQDGRDTGLGLMLHFEDKPCPE